ncbi:MAG: flagellar basal body L-ring protein FlgH [Novosphingobium sp.]|nr:flagellar basal body L-ring protein FlgH [Novosphingobium sp.]
MTMGQSFPAVALLAWTGMALAQPVHAKQRDPQAFAAALPEAPPAPRAAGGGIFDASAGYASLYEGMRARRVGDPLTILLVERTTAAKSVRSKSGRSGSAAITQPTSGPLDFLKADALKMGSNSSFNGQGDAGQTSTFSSTLSVTIAEVRPNGTALVRGEKRMLLSQGDEWVRFSGIVRLADVDQDNRITSARVADARMEYSGKGALQRASRQGWLGQFFNMISPF